MRDCKYYIKIIDGDSKSYHYFNGEKEAKEFYSWSLETINPRCEITYHERISVGWFEPSEGLDSSVEENAALALADYYNRTE